MGFFSWLSRLINNKLTFNPRESCPDQGYFYDDDSETFDEEDYFDEEEGDSEDF